jgi:hypothetical protein
MNLNPAIPSFHIATDDEQVTPSDRFKPKTVHSDAPLHPKSDIPRDDPDKDKDNRFAPEITKVLGEDKVREIA